MKKTKNIKVKIIIILFLTALVLPNIIQILGLEKELINNENRKHKSLPKFNIKKPISSIGSFKNYYLENFGLKTSLVNGYINFKSNILDENPIPNRLVTGKNGWLFLGNQYNNTLNDSFGNDLFTEKQLENSINYFNGLKEFFKSQNISFYIVVPPDKDKIYQEFLPFKLKQNTTKLETLKAALKNRANINIIDLSVPLLKNKANHQLYFKTDSHWNYYGSYYGYNYLIDVLNKTYAIDKVSLNHFNIKQDFQTGDLQKMINKSEPEATINIIKKGKSNIEKIPASGKTLHFKNKSKNLKVMLHRDSFARAWFPFLNETFGEIIYHTRYTIDKSEIKAFKPDIVIFEIVERNIDMFGQADIYKN